MRMPVEVGHGHLGFTLEDKDGEWCAYGIEARETADEIMRRVKAYDSLVAQRDALVAACIVSRQLLAGIAKDGAVILQDVGMDTMVRRVEQATRAALALVEAAQKSDNATA